MIRSRRVFIAIFVVFYFFAFAIFNHCYGQQHLTGIVKDTSLSPLASASVRLFVNDSSKVVAGQTKSDGSFDLNVMRPGKYILSIFHIGFEESLLPVTLQGHDINVGTIVLRLHTKELKTVTILGKKADVKQNGDRLEVNVQGSMLAASGTVLDVMQRLPGVEINKEANTIRLNGKDDVGILLNGKYVKIPTADLVLMMSNMDANNIQKIEIMSTPPAKYDASNSGGLLNIVLKQSTQQHTSFGSYTLGAGYGYKPKYKLAGNWIYAGTRWSFSGDVSYNEDHGHKTYLNEKNIESAAGQNIRSSTFTDRFPDISTLVGRLDINYNDKDRTKIGLSLFTTINKFKQHVNGSGSGMSAPDSLQKLSLTSDENSSRNLYIGDFNVDKKLGKFGLLSLDAEILHYYNNNPVDYQYDYVNEATGSQYALPISTRKQTPVNIGIFGLGYSESLGKHLKIEGGYKNSSSYLKNDVQITGADNLSLNTSDIFTGLSRYREFINAVYLSSVYQFNPSTRISGGLRYENSSTQLTGDSIAGKMTTSINRLFPNLLISKKLSSDAELQVGFDERIARPTYYDLAPYLIFIEPTTYNTGNPNLKPAISANVRAIYSYRRFIASMEYNSVSSPILRAQPVLATNGNYQAFIPINIDHLNTLNLTVIQPISFSKWYELGLTGQLSFQNTEVSSSLKSNDTFFTIKGTHTVNLSKEISLQLYSYYQSPRINGYLRRSSSSLFDFAAQKKFTKANSRLQISLSNIFGDQYSERSQTMATSGLLNTYSYNWHETRILRLTYIHNFGTASSKVNVLKSKNQDIEERIK